MSTENPTPNRLSREKSPYLLQHAHNPVDWYPWGDEAFARAREENRPILVSIGYSTCHWCHVMEHESYENPTTAVLMNRYLINIKVDREERPDVDKIYMTAVSAMTGSGGWPLNMFLTPDLKPFFGGTYFPPVPRWGQPAWGDVVKHIGQSWEDPAERQKMIDAGQQITASLKRYMDGGTAPIEGDPAWLDHGFQALQDMYDAVRGGFAQAPKFPMPVYQNFLLRYWARTKKPEALQMVVQTVRQMAHGGIYDQVGGGFSRYSTDAQWHVPHFEKMLYDNAQLAVNLAEIYQATKDKELAQTLQETLGYVLRDMTHPGGGFYSAEDADSLPAADSTEKTEGAFYVWEAAEIQALCGVSDAPIVQFYYGVRPHGNAAHDPQGEFKNKNILYVAHTVAETAREFKRPEDEIKLLLARARKILFDARARRPRPHLDDKIISAWNGLMISGFAKAYQALGDPAYLAAAQKAALFVRTHLYDTASGRLARRWRDGESGIAGIADDYAFLAQGLLDLYEAGFDTQWLEWAETLTDQMTERFYDRARGGYYMTAVDQDANLLQRVKEDMDNVEPSASAVAALNLLRLHAYTDRSDFRDMAIATIRAFGTPLKLSPRAMPQMLVALDYSLSEAVQIIVVGKKDSADTQQLIAKAQENFIPIKTVLLLDRVGSAHFAKTLPFTKDMREIDGMASAYVCRNHTCKAPTTNPDALKRLLS